MRPASERAPGNELDPLLQLSVRKGRADKIVHGPKGEIIPMVGFL